ncbi:hypothetical protein [Methanolobus sp.]|uniref:hypothetical protein n=1 Tax=Methanolobus sp. TaxID=1874737 RepID=UPI0025EA1754|nr:hypothetical protein [Methanolobus sp.]
MGFSSGAKTLPALIEDIANQIIASSANWVDGDPSWTTVGTLNNNARRCLRFTGDAQDIWIALECVNSNIITFASSRRGKGLRVTLSSSWDYVNNTYPSQASSESQTIIPFQARTGGNTVVADMGTLLLTYFLWTDATGFTIMAVPEPNATDNAQASFICTVERMTAKEYSDGLTNFVCYCQMNHNSIPDGCASYMRGYIRAFAFMSNQNDFKPSGIQFWKGKWYAFKSTGSGKVYFVKPLYCNDAAEYMPIGQSELFFQYSPESGLVDGDVIAVQGATTKYICKAIQSPNSANTLYYAIKYVA